MKYQFLILILFYLIPLSVFSQKDSNKSFVYPIPTDSLNNLSYDYLPEDNSFDEIFMYKTQIQTQKMMKNLFLAGFIFMTIVVIFLFYFNNTKIKQVFAMIKIQERELFIKKFEVDKLSTIINNTMDGIVILNKEQSILWNNLSFLQLYKYTEEDLKNKKINFFDFEDEEIKQLIVKCKNDNKPIQFTFEHKLGENTFHIQRRIIPLVDNNTNDVNYVIIDTDYTALKMALKNI